MQQTSDSGARVAFTLSLIHQRQDAQRVTCLALHSEAQAVLLGLSSGYLEEHRLQRPHGGGGGGLRLQAERKVFARAPVAGVGVLAQAGRAVALSDDGAVVLVALESMQVAPLAPSQTRGAVAIACAPPDGPTARLAVAVRSGKKASKVLVYAVLPAHTPSSLSGQPALLVAQVPLEEVVVDLAWAGKVLLVAVAGGYLVLEGSSVTRLASDLPCAPLLGTIPTQRRGLLLWEDCLLLITDSSGSADAPPALLPRRPLALASAGLFVVAVSEEGVHVFDRSTSVPVQHIPWAHDDAWVASAGRLPVASDPDAGRCVVLATSSAVLLLEPVALQQQVRELLRRRRFDRALELIDACAREGAAWAEAARAEAGLLMLQAGAFEQAGGVLALVPPEVLQPAELLPLFPQYTSRWLPQLASHRRIPTMDAIVAAAAHPDADAAFFGSAPPSPRPTAATPRPPFAPPFHGGGDAGGDTSVGALMWRAKRALSSYLLTVRTRPGLVLPDALDTLTVQLLCDCRAAAELEALVGGAHAADAGDAEAAMRRAGRWLALAHMCAADGRPSEALRLWQDVSEGALHEAPAPSGAAADAGGDAPAAALGAATSELARGAAGAAAAAPPPVPAPLVLDHLPWVLASSPAGALRVLCRRRDLPWRTALALTAKRSDGVRWRYLTHLVYAGGAAEGQLHTLLAEELAAAAARAACVGEVGPVRLAAMAAALPLAAAPNATPAGGEAAAAAAAVAACGRAARGAKGGAGGPALAGQLVRQGELGAAWAGGGGGVAGAVLALAVRVQDQPGLAAGEAWAEADPREGAAHDAGGAVHPAALRALPQLQRCLADLAPLQPPPPSSAGSLARPNAAAAAPADGGGGGGEAAAAAVATAAARQVLLLRGLLAFHLQASLAYDAWRVAACLAGPPGASAGGPGDAAAADAAAPAAAPAPEVGGGEAATGAVCWWPELGLALSRQGDHDGCLRAWALHSGLVDESVRYCRALASPETWSALLDTLLQPGDGAVPRYADACAVVCAEGACLDPLRVVRSLPDGAPICEAAPTLERLLGGMQHRRRMSQVVRALHRAQRLALAADKAALQSEAVVVSEDTACRGCARLLGNRIFLRYPSGVVLCSRCAGAASGVADAADSAQQRRQQR